MILCAAAISTFAQSESAYDQDESSSDSSSVSLLDPSRLSVNHMMSFGMGGSQLSSLKTQSLYSTMLQYRFDAPLVLNLNFSLPIHSSWNMNQNLSRDNLESLEYFKNVPFDVSLTWQPAKNLFLSFSMANQSDPFNRYNGLFPGSYEFRQTFDRGGPRRDEPGPSDFFWDR
ncbi:MAG: hypothetical protein ACLFVQ_13725, partial [Chitinispirillaceae bacterium]